jgi:hypothetical protein
LYPILEEHRNITKNEYKGFSYINIPRGKDGMNPNAGWFIKAL